MSCRRRVPLLHRCHAGVPVLRTVGVALAGAALGLPATAQWLAQSTDNGSAVGSPGTGQSFVAPSTASISRIAVRPQDPFSGTLHIYTGGAGSGTPGAVGSPAYSQAGVSLANTTSGGAWRTVVLTTPFPVTAGNSYTFIFARTGFPAFYANSTNPYANGNAIHNYSETTLVPNWDLAFQIWAAQSISFTSAAPTAPRLGDSYTVTATATSGLPVVFTIDAASAAVCTIVGSTVTITGVGTCIINANQGGDAAYDPAPQAQQAFAVAAAPASIPTLSFWGLLGLSSLLGLWGAARSRRRAG